MTLSSCGIARLRLHSNYRAMVFKKLHYLSLCHCNFSPVSSPDLALTLSRA